MRSRVAAAAALEILVCSPGFVVGGRFCIADGCFKDGLDLGVSQREPQGEPNGRKRQCIYT